MTTPLFSSDSELPEAEVQASWNSDGAPGDEAALHIAALPPKVIEGNARNLKQIPRASVDVIVTSPPYWQRRDYGHPDQLGQEDTPAAYVRALVGTMKKWESVLKSHGSVFLNLGDTYRGGYLVGVPAMVEVAVRRAGWSVLNHVSWTKSIGMPEPLPYRLAGRHEPVLHLTRAERPTDVFVDLHALSSGLGQTSNPGDVWDVHPARSRTDHLAPFPPGLAERAIRFTCPERICSACGRPHKRHLVPTTELDPSRQQARRAMELAEEHGLTDAHLAAVRAVGISDAGKGRRIQSGAGRNAAETQRLADEAKAVLGGYFREFTFGPKRHVGWDGCDCGAPTQPGTVLDPFMGSGTTLRVARDLGMNAVGVDLVPPESLDA